MILPLQNQIGPLGAPRVVSSGSTLLDGLLAFYRLDETSGVRADSSGHGCYLTEFNTVGSVPGLLGNAASFVRENNERLKDVAGAVDYSGYPTIALWFKFNSAGYGQYQYQVSGKDGTNGIALRLREAAPYYSCLAWDGANQVNTQNYGDGPLTPGQWYCVITWVSPDDRKIRHQFNNTGTLEVSPTALAGPVTKGIFMLNNENYEPQSMSGATDLVGVWGRNLTADERTEYFNGGAGFDPTA